MTITLADVGSGFKRTAINSNFTALEAEINTNLLSKLGGKALEADLDVNSQRLINLVDAINGREPVTLDQLNGALSAAGSGLISAQQEIQAGSDLAGSVQTFTGITYTLSSNNLYMFRNGTYQTKGVDYNETSTSSITWLVTINSGDSLVAITNLATTNSVANTSAITHTVGGSPQNLATYLRRPVKNFSTLAEAVADVGLVDGDAVSLAEHTTGNGGGAMWDVVLSSTVTENAVNIVQGVGVGTLSIVLRVDGESEIDVRQWGALLDGATDDGAAIQAAGDTGFPVFIKESSLNITGTITGTYYTRGTVTVSGGGTITIRDLLSDDGSALTDTPISPNSPRSIIQYGSATTVKIRDTIYPMGGFRFHGSYRKTRAKSFTSSAQSTTVSTSTDLAFGMSSVVLENWYGVFACANDGDANASFLVVPFLRADSVSTDTITLRKAGESVHVSSPQTYTWAADALNGAECLVITETIEGRAIAFSGRETTITDSTTTTVTLDSIGTVAAGDWILPAPNVAFNNYRYCGAFYVDTAEVRNIADSGTIVKSRGIFDTSGTNTGSVASAEIRQPSGYISPLATAVYLQSTGSLSTSTTGQYVENFDLDSGSHTISSGDLTKALTSNLSFNFGEMYLTFAFGPQYYYANAGALVATRVNGQQNLYGWIEP